LIGLINQI